MIFVIGAARSGTTLTMSVLEMCGANLGKVNRLNEISAVRDGVVKPILKSHGLDPMGQNPIPARACRWNTPQLRRMILDAAGEATAVKIIKGLHFWPDLVTAFPDANWLFVYRDPWKVADSCLRTSFMWAYHTADEWAQWAETYQARCWEIGEAVPEDQFRMVAPAHFTSGHTGALRGAVEDFGLQWREDAVDRVFNREAWHG